MNKFLYGFDSCSPQISVNAIIHMMNDMDLDSSEVSSGFGPIEDPYNINQRESVASNIEILEFKRCYNKFAILPNLIIKI